MELDKSLFHYHIKKGSLYFSKSSELFFNLDKQKNAFFID